MTQIQLPIRKELSECYLRSEFKCPEGPIFINAYNDIGKYIISRIRFCVDPVKIVYQRAVDITIDPDHLPAPVEGLNIILPKNNRQIPENHFLFFTKMDIEAINGFLDASFNSYMRLYLSEAIAIGLNKKDAIEALLAGIGVMNFEIIKKREYREQLRIMKKHYEAIRQRDLRIRQKIRNQIKNQV